MQPLAKPSAKHRVDRLHERLQAHIPVVLPALLLCDFGHLAREIERLEEAGAVASVPIEVHLMVEEPDQTVADYARVGADILTVHFEALPDPRRTLQRIASLGSRAHLAISPTTPVEKVFPFLDACAGVLVMSVEPGFGGQAFNPLALEKLSALRAIRSQRELSFCLAVDGGISTQTVASVAAAGAEMIVAGSAVIRSKNYTEAICDLERMALAACVTA